jgi:D-arabinose 1-dehydrogenase-like Zn-dependent alcohol dehydrogenase
MSKNNTCHAYATKSAHAPLEKTEIELGELHPEQIEIAVSHCGICHSDWAKRE